VRGDSDAFRAGGPAEGGRMTEIGIWGRVLVAFARFGSPVMAVIANAGKKLRARIAPLFIQLRENGTIGIYRTTTLSAALVVLSLTVVALSFAAVYTVDYAGQAAAVVVTVPLVVLVLTFQRGKHFGPTAGTVAG
jgi:hypothetical protein